MTGPVKSKKILLIEPPFYRLFKEGYALIRYPLSLAYLAGAVAGRTSWEVMAYNSDFRLPAEPFQVTHFTGPGFDEYRAGLKDLDSPVYREIRDTTTEFSPSIVGLTIKSATWASARNTAKIIKKSDPDITVVAGGPHVTTTGPEVLSCPDIDIGVLGEGEETLVELLGALEKQTPLERVKGIVFRDGKNTVKTPGREKIKDLDSLAFPHRAAPLVLKDYASYPKLALGRVMASRGCPFNCFFCGSRAIWGPGVRKRQPEAVARELAALEKSRIGRVHFEDDTFGVDHNYLKRLTRAMAARVPDMEWSCETHVNLATDENVAAMKKAGCRAIQIGLESGSNRILKAMGKKFDLDQAFRACESIKNQGLRLETFFLAGFPGETEASLAQTLLAIEKVPADKVIFSLFTPYPGTEAFGWCQDLGLIGPEYDPSLHYHQSPLNCFCPDLDLDRFRTLAGEIEKKVVEKNNRAGHTINL